MVTQRQYLVPGDGYINEVTNSNEFLVPGAAYVNETTSTAVTGYGRLLSGKRNRLVLDL